MKERERNTAMPSQFDSMHLSAIIQAAVRERAEQAKEFTQSAQGENPPADTIASMINGKRINEKRCDYKRRHEQNDLNKSAINAEFKAVLDQQMENLKSIVDVEK